jgi:hypothetical protein
MPRTPQHEGPGILMTFFIVIVVIGWILGTLVHFGVIGQ